MRLFSDGAIPPASDIICFPILRLKKLKKITFTESLRDRFWSKVKKSPGCWLWTANKNNKGYGTMTLGAANLGKGLAHRISYALHYKEIPAGIEVMHHCDNPSCVKPTHLFLGTHAENMLDMRNKGTAYYRSNRFTPMQVSTILEMRKAKKSVNAIGLEMGCDKGTIVRFLKRHGLYQPINDV